MGAFSAASRKCSTALLPNGAGVLALGLVGTTVVPYNLFLGSGIARGQDVRELRFGLIVAVGLGGLISMAVLVVGAALDGAFSFQALAGILGDRLGPWGARLFAVGLFCGRPLVGDHGPPSPRR